MISARDDLMVKIALSYDKRRGDNVQLTIQQSRHTVSFSSEQRCSDKLTVLRALISSQSALVRRRVNPHQVITPNHRVAQREEGIRKKESDTYIDD